MRIAIVAESFAPQVNGVSNSIMRLLEFCRDHGHDVVVIAPGYPVSSSSNFAYGFRVVRLRSLRIPGIASFRVGIPSGRIYSTIYRFQPDVVYCASPFVVGAAGILAARLLSIPCIAAFQTDVAGFATTYRLGAMVPIVWWWLRVIHNAADRTVAPSTASITALVEHNIDNVQHWGRGVDTQLFQPANRQETLRRSWGAPDKTIVGYVGRLAKEKNLHRLIAVANDPTMQLVIVGDGPLGEHLRRLLPQAVFTGTLHGAELSRAYASFDVFVHPGEHETFGQTIQEALASGVPVIATSVGGPADLIRVHETGELLEPEEFSERIVAAIKDIRHICDYPAMARAARLSVVHNGWERLCAQLLHQCDQVIAARTAVKAYG
ncbi:glycosyltransferase [Corynebacterium mustelae]|uniref:Glycosyltransferase n=1 Tax=Corynebacterium mustelae TaxID=571915 RepID=A0A0G3GUA4_9CORY|nr:glycosyltransferase family 1 protein [Corynebacterium mustelae]AKK04714.1 glycosyltransferase [Corynebacterium mustelae]